MIDALRRRSAAEALCPGPCGLQQEFVLCNGQRVLALDGIGDAP
jgi:hypothetical protein